ncbi:hypothetical protein HYU13_01320 [Candidatus Woesearchaeota archaeon]|nr:hypothetical protein [Candidatus Woesearchaeota archaeon]
MKKISDQKVKALFIGAILVSLFSTLTMLDYINKKVAPFPSITGFASSGTGQVNVTIASVTSITASDLIINFGSCSPNITSGSNLSSNDTTNSWGTAGVCLVGGALPATEDNITIQNDGNDDVNVTVQSSVIASTFLGGTSPEFYFNSRNASSRPGCRNLSVKNSSFISGVRIPQATEENSIDSNMTGLQWNWKNITAAYTPYIVCENLSYTDSKDQVAVFARVFLPGDAPVRIGRNASLIFTAASS